ncbi:MAG TPA: histidine phosphotransferase family protein [Parvularculaceae bacterium]|nr:histidine phosphotransferase family protein [Parvularculaceae bacterium]
MNPVGALASGLEVLHDPSMDASMKEAAVDLIKSSAEKSVALLKYARLAYGASGGLGVELPFEEARHVLEGVFAWQKAKLDWRIAPGQAPKDEVKALLVLALAAGECAPRGGDVVVEGARGGYEIRVTGQRVIIQEDMIRALEGDATELKPKFTPHYLSALAARTAGGGVELTHQEGSARISARFSAAAAQSGPAALTAG